MFARIFGYIWLGMGILFLIWPQFLRNRLIKKGLRRLRRYFILLALLLGGALVPIGFKFQGIWPKVLVIIGILGVMKGIFLLNFKASETLFNRAAKLPINYFRIGALVQIAIGIILLYLR